MEGERGKRYGELGKVEKRLEVMEWGDIEREDNRQKRMGV